MSRLLSNLSSILGSECTGFSPPTATLIMAPKVYQDLADKATTFKQLANDVKWEEKTFAALMKRDVQDLDDFRYLFNDEAAISA